MASVAQLPAQPTQPDNNPLYVPDVTERPRTSASEAPPARKWLQNLRRPKSSHSSKTSTLRNRRPLLPEEELRRDSALVSLSPTASAHSTGQDENPSTQNTSSSPASAADVPTIVVHEDTATPTSTKVTESEQDRNLAAAAQGLNEANTQTTSNNFRGITTEIPTGGFEDFHSQENMQFTKRGTMLLNGQRVTEMLNSQPTESEIRTKPMPRLNPPTSRVGRALSADDVTLSQKVRSMYEYGGEDDLDLTGQTVVEEDDERENATSDATLAPTPNGSVTKAPTIARPVQSLNVRQPYEVAGGVEDWEDVEVGDVDRYGFIIPKKGESRESNKSAGAFDAPGPYRPAQALLDASASPRRNHSVRRAPSRARSSRLGMKERPNSGAMQGPGSIYSYRSNKSFARAAGTLRFAANRLPHNKSRRWMDEAGDMLTPPPGLAQLAEQEDGGQAVIAMKKKEWQREDKWKKMGKTGKRTTRGGGMLFNFDPKDPKVVSRTWKGIPDRWRASAWYSFLAASARKQKDAPGEEDLIQAFRQLQEENSADDMQIDCDVPRTINSHIMFRRRYRGGQRLLFRVLHALSLYFPDTGYVQGMAAITATLLCYYDEEHAFIMTVRLWQLRGLQKLYQDGFGGLMEALEDFRKNWLRGSEVARKLVGPLQTVWKVCANTIRKDELAIPPTSYGTRWYLTLFNYSIPFPAQLRVWDVFMLLGDVSNSVDEGMTKTFSADLDILHATSAALIDATREILLDSDFENAMKVLTSWIPVKDEDLLMKVAFAEWKLRKRRA